MPLNDNAVGLLACAVAGAFTLAGCASFDSSPPTAQAAAITPLGLDLLTDSGTYTSGEETLTNAESELVHDCMTAKGFRYVAGDSTSASAADPSSVVNLAHRRSQGYGLYEQYASGATGKTTSTAARTGPMTNDEYVRQLPAQKAAAYMKALRGDTSDLSTYRMRDGTIEFSGKGCEADSRKRLYGSLTTYAELAAVPQNLNATLTAHVRRDAAYTALMRKWSACMAAKGYHYALPSDAQAQLNASYAKLGATEALRRQEIATAVADGTCALRLRIRPRSWRSGNAWPVPC